MLQSLYYLETTFSQPVRVEGKWLAKNGNRPCSPLGTDQSCGSTEFKIIASTVGHFIIGFVPPGPHCVAPYTCPSLFPELLSLIVTDM